MEHRGREDEREIKERIRQAKAQQDRSGTYRRKTLEKLIDLTHTPNSSLKILAAENIPELFKDFPDQEEAAINAVYDLCEDQSANVRKQGYAAITAVSKAANKWVKRNTDVLLQLLQSDEPDEVEVVKQALIAHLEFEPRVTLGVLCDQIMPGAESSADPEELYMRDRLRALVLDFLAREAKQALVERYAAPGGDGEDVLVNGLTAAISSLGPQDTETIVKKLLLSLHCYSPGSPRSRALLLTLREKAQLCLKTDSTKNTLATTRFYIDLMSYVVVEKNLAPPIELMPFYLPSLVTKIALQRLPSDDQIYVICNLAETLAACERNTQDRDLPQLSTLRNQSAEASRNLFECLANAGVADERSRNACKVLLRCCLRRKTEGWVVPAYFRSTLEALRAKSEQFKDVQALIRSLAEQPASAPDKPKAVAGTPEPQKSAQTTPGSGRLAMAPPLRPASRPRESPVASTSASVSSPLNPIPPNKHSLGPDSSPRPPKRVRMSTDETPSLLSRLGSSASKGTDYRPIVARPANAVPKNPPPGVAVMDSGQTPQGGYSIKGAARAINEPRRTSSTGSTSSLLERLNGGVGGVGGGRSDDDRARRKNW